MDRDEIIRVLRAIEASGCTSDTRPVPDTNMGAPDLVEGINIVFMTLNLRVLGSIPRRLTILRSPSASTIFLGELRLGFASSGRLRRRSSKSEGAKDVRHSAARTNAPRSGATVDRTFCTHQSYRTWQLQPGSEGN